MNDSPSAFQKVEKFRTNLVGVTFENTDGVNRQQLIKNLKPGDALILAREQENKYDKFAIAVFRSDGIQVGYLPGGDIRMANHLDSGGTAEIRVIAVTGGGDQANSLSNNIYGCAIEVVKHDPKWIEVIPFMDQSSKIEKLLTKTQQLEVKSPENAIRGYLKVIKLIRELDEISTIAAHWRRARYPINRLSLLLERKGESLLALDAILDYEQYNDVYGIIAEDERSVASRKQRLLKRM